MAACAAHTNGATNTEDVFHADIQFWNWPKIYIWFCLVQILHIFIVNILSTRFDPYNFKFSQFYI